MTIGFLDTIALLFLNRQSKALLFMYPQYNNTSAPIVDYKRYKLSWINVLLNNRDHHISEYKCLDSKSRTRLIWHTGEYQIDCSFWPPATKHITPFDVLRDSLGKNSAGGTLTLWGFPKLVGHLNPIIYVTETAFYLLLPGCRVQVLNRMAEYRAAC